ncbi:Protein transport protein BOS1, partial [Bienertia sinuspersici]
GNSWLWEVGGVKLLVDPILEGNLDFGIPWLYDAAKKFVKNFQLSDLTGVDCLLITQSLDDHCHLKTLKPLSAMFPNLKVVATPNAQANLDPLFSKVTHVKQTWYQSGSVLSHHATHPCSEDGQLEEDLATLKVSMTDQVNAALAQMSQVAATLEKTSQTFSSFLERMEGRLNRSREEQELSLEQFRAEQRAFQEEICHTLAHKETPHSSGESLVRKGVGRHIGGIGGNEGGSGGGTNGGGASWRLKKLDLPLFEGNYPDGWILRAERYFQFYWLSEEEKLEAAVVALEGDALFWYQWENRRRSFTRWEEMKSMVLSQFRSTSTGSLYEQWLDHRQTGECQCLEYRWKFIELLAPLEEIAEEVSKGQFVNGLKDEIRAKIRLLGPNTLDDAMDLALKVEDKVRTGYGEKKEWVLGHFYGPGVTYLEPGQDTKIEGRNGSKVKICATAGPVLGPPWQRPENGYILSCSECDLTLYYEPHCVYNEEILKGKQADIVITPVIKQLLPKFTLVSGQEDAVKLAKLLCAKYVLIHFS